MFTDMEGFSGWYRDTDENGHRCRMMNGDLWYPSKWEVLNCLNDTQFGNWNWYFKDDSELNNLNLSDVPYPDIRVLEYGCYQMFTETKPDRKYSVTDNDGKLEFTRDDDNGDFYVFVTPLDKNTTWCELLLKTDELINRVKDCQHHGVNSFKTRSEPTYYHSPNSLELIMDS